MQKYIKQIIFILSAGVILFPSEAIPQKHFWELADGPPGSQVYTVTSNLKGEVYISVAPKSNYGTTDDGQTWSMMYNNLTVVDVGCSTSGEIYAASSFGDIYYSKGFGLQWDFHSRVSQPVLAFIVNPIDFMYLASYAGGIYRSIDKGRTWSMIGNGIPPGFNTNNFTSDSANGEMFAATNKGLFVAQDYGTSWRKIWNDTSNVLSVAVASDRTLYAGTMSLGIYKSTDKGNSWIPLDSFFQKKAIRYLICTKNKNVIAAAGNVMYVSADAGLSWVSVQLDESIISKLHVSRTGVVYATCKGKVFRSRDEGVTWEDMRFYNTSLVSLNTFPNGDNYCITSDGELYRLKNEEKKWIKLSLPSGTVKAYFVKHDPTGSIILKSDTNRFYHSSDGGLTWLRLKSPSGTIDVSFNNIGNPIAATPGGIYFSTDSGVTWTHWDLGNIHIYTIITDSSRALFVGTMNAGIFRSEDGINWQQMNSGLPQNMSITYLCVDSINNLFAQGVGARHGLFRYNYVTGSWNQVARDLTDVNFLSMTVDLHNTLYMTIPGAGVYYSTDTGENWRLLNDGLPSTDVNLITAMKDGMILVAARDAGLYSSTGNVVSVEHQKAPISPFALHQNYPNPFTSSTAIGFRLLAAGFVRLEVFDMLGRKVATLVDEEVEAGEHISKFEILKSSIVNLSDGMYFYRLTSNGYSETRTMILIR